MKRTRFSGKLRILAKPVENEEYANTGAEEQFILQQCPCCKKWLSSLFMKKPYRAVCATCFTCGCMDFGDTFRPLH